LNSNSTKSIHKGESFSNKFKPGKLANSPKAKVEKYCEQKMYVSTLFDLERWGRGRRDVVET